jgi:acetylornithine deacetylase/succinyl-diaminopimelate desuccinylase-like protein
MNDLRLIRQSHEKEVVQVCQKLLKIQSVNPPGDELAAAEYISGVLAKAGLEVELLKHSPARASVISRLRGSGKAPALLFNGISTPSQWARRSGFMILSAAQSAMEKFGDGGRRT